MKTRYVLKQTSDRIAILHAAGSLLPEQSVAESKYNIIVAKRSAHSAAEPCELGHPGAALRALVSR